MGRKKGLFLHFEKFSGDATRSVRPRPVFHFKTVGSIARKSTRLQGFSNSVFVYNGSPSSIYQIASPFYPCESSLVDILTTLELFDLIGGLGLVIAAIGAWMGYNRARLLLMAFVFLFAFDLAVTVLDDFSSQVSGSALSDQGQGSQLILVLPPILLVVIYLWYFNRAPVKAYYLPVEPEE